ncbi:MAG: hypothetical protein LBK68_01985 [Candidatus Margulisbacteria bacterium]|jgi:hypothetical protein|nr:hypothetical protein [Candidatus Margulisiibacteriota bacterium]
MKKILLCLCVLSLGFSAVRLQGQASSMGYGPGLGLGIQLIPFLLETGLEGSLHEWPPVTVKDSYRGSPIEGTFGLSMTRVGVYAKFSIPGLNLIPVLGFFANPTIHFGTQHGIVGVDGEAKIPGANTGGAPLSGRYSFQGSYGLLGFPNYLLWFFIEPAFGASSIPLPFVGLRTLYEAQIALGVSF